MLDDVLDGPSATPTGRVPFLGAESAERLCEPCALADQRRGGGAHHGIDINDGRTLVTRRNPHLPHPFSGSTAGRSIRSSRSEMSRPYVNTQPGHHHPAPGRGNQHYRRPALPRPPTQLAPTDDHEVLTDFAEALLLHRAADLRDRLPPSTRTPAASEHVAGVRVLGGARAAAGSANHSPARREGGLGPAAHT